jgi:hypothetical protein
MLCTVALVVAAPLPALAASFNFSYTFASGNVLEGVFEGDISLVDPNVIENVFNVTASYNGTELGGGAPVGPRSCCGVVTFNGVGLLFGVEWEDYGDMGFTMSSARISHYDGSTLIFDTDLALPGLPPTFDLSRWMVTEKMSSPVPEPAGATLLSA